MYSTKRNRKLKAILNTAAAKARKKKLNKGTLAKRFGN
jgi:hypothetical protein